MPIDSTSVAPRSPVVSSRISNKSTKPLPGVDGRSTWSWSALNGSRLRAAQERCERVRRGAGRAAAIPTKNIAPARCAPSACARVVLAKPQNPGGRSAATSPTRIRSCFPRRHASVRCHQWEGIQTRLRRRRDLFRPAEAHGTIGGERLDIHCVALISTQAH